MKRFGVKAVYRTVDMDADRLTNENSLVRFRQPIEVKAAFVIAVLRQMAKAKALFDAGPTARRFAGRDVKQETPANRS